MGYRYLNTGTAVPVFAAEPPLATEGSLYYNSTSDIFYICNGTQWNLVSNASPTTTGGTRTIDALSEGGTFSYDLGDDFTDDVDTDAQLIYTLTSGTLPSGCTLPTTGNSEFTGTASGVSSNTNYTWTIKATDTSGGTATQNYQQTINTVVPTVTGGTVTISSVNEGSSASYDVDTNFTFTTGSTFSAYSLQSGSLPSGLSLNTSSGVISGTMGEVASTTAYSFTIRATDTDGDTADQAYSWTITNVPLSATGGTITTYSSGGVNYKVNTFTSGGTITFNKAGSVDVLIVAGGGGGGAGGGGGGGGGGILYGSSYNVSAQNYTVTIGAGGSTHAYYNAGIGDTGGSSAFGAVSVVGGGGGGSHTKGNPATGGANGGGQQAGSTVGYTTRLPGTSVSVTGFTYYGGNSGGYTPTGLTSYQGGGGAGAMAQGGNASGSACGNGGAGKQLDIDGTSYYYSGGGGGSLWASGTAGHGGAGGGGGGSVGEGGTIGNGDTSGRNNGGNGNSGNNVSGGGAGGLNTGGGGGANQFHSGNSDPGGSGIVIVRYAV